MVFGASAGGLEALLEILPLLEANGRSRFILAQHMARTGHSDLVVRVLSRKTALRVVEASDGMTVEADTIHVIPAGFDGILDDGRLHLCEPVAGSHSTPSVNRLLESVARSCGTEAVAVVLSGAGSDGVLGCRDIRQHGGTVIIQASGTSAIHGMAGAVERAQLAEHVLGPTDIARHLNALSPRRSLPGPLPRHPLTGSSQLQALLHALALRSGVDFTMYRHGTLLRRMERRSEALHMADLGAYMTFAMHKESELDALQRMFLISWSWFFRDAPAWAALRREVASQLEHKPADEAYRVWVPGCASGEECYSVAMLLQDLAPERRLEIRGSDLSATAIASARNARYLPTAFRELPDGYRERFTTGDPSRPRIVDDLRDACTFIQEDALTTTTPTELDLVCCRNLLIYMRRELHEQLLTAVHHALRPGGLLFLGMSEGLARDDTARYSVVDATHRIYRRRTAQ